MYIAKNVREYSPDWRIKKRTVLDFFQSSSEIFGTNLSQRRCIQLFVDNDGKRFQFMNLETSISILWVAKWSYKCLIKIYFKLQNQ